MSVTHTRLASDGSVLNGPSSAARQGVVSQGCPTSARMRRGVWATACASPSSSLSSIVPAKPRELRHKDRPTTGQGCGWSHAVHQLPVTRAAFAAHAKLT
jgi:hypothetical protein